MMSRVKNRNKLARKVVRPKRLSAGANKTGLQATTLNGLINRHQALLQLEKIQNG